MSNSATTTEVFNCKVEEFYKIISDYEHYPDFLSEVKKCKVLKTDGARKLVEFQVFMVKSFTYNLWLTESPTTEISWTLESGNLFKVSQGFWRLADEAGKTRATYSVEAQFKVFVPGPIARALVNVNLPNMMSSYRKRVTELYG